MHFRLFAILLLLVAGSTTVVSGQTQQEPTLDMEFTDIPLSEAISRIEKNTRYTFFYDAKQTDLSPTREPQGEANADFSRLEGNARPDRAELHHHRTPDRPDPGPQVPGPAAHDHRRRQRLVRNAAGGRGRHARGRQHPRCGNGSQRQLHAHGPRRRHNAQLHLSGLREQESRRPRHAEQREGVPYGGRREDGGRGGRGLRNPEKGEPHGRHRHGGRKTAAEPVGAFGGPHAARLRPGTHGLDFVGTPAIRPASTSAASPRSTAVRRWCWSTAPKAT